MRRLLVFLALFCVGCADDSFRRVEVLDEFRVLGIVTTDPEVSGAGNVDVFPYVSDPNGAGRTVTGTYEYCLDPGVSFGATPSCVGVPGAVTLAYSINFTLDSDFAANGYTGQAATPATVVVPATIFTGRSTREQFNGIAMIVVFRFTVDGREVSAFRRIVATNRGSENDNPAVPTLLLNGGAFGITKPSKGSVLTVSPLNDEEAYQVQTVDESIENRTESYEVALYVSQGELDRSKISISQSAEFKESANGAQPFISVVMVRDERGGLSFNREFVP
jgi:hypothetical protein